MSARGPIAVLGYGRMGQALARTLADAGYEVHAGTRRPDAQRPGPGISVTTFAEAARDARILFLALPWPHSLTVMNEIGPALGPATVVIDCSNPERGEGPGLVLGTSTSGAEEIAASVARGQVVKALNHVYAELLLAARRLDARPSAFYCGDDAAAKGAAASVLTDLGFDPVDVGPLESARYLEPMSQMLVHLVRNAGLGPADIALQLQRTRII